MAAFGLPKKTDADKAARKQAIQDATKEATQVPYKVMELCFESMEVAKAMAEIGNPNSVTDAGVGALAARAGVQGAYLNVKINAADIEDEAFRTDILTKGAKIEADAIALETEILKVVNGKI